MLEKAESLRRIARLQLELQKKGIDAALIIYPIDIYYFAGTRQNSLLYIVRPRRGAICHTKNLKGEPRNCYYRRIDLDSLALTNLDA